MSSLSRTTNCAVKRHPATRTDSLPWLFVSERGQPLTRQSVNYLVGAAAGRAGLPNVHPHTLRHSCGLALANKRYDLRLIQDYLGHRDPGIPSTTPAPRAGASKGYGVDDILAFGQPLGAGTIVQKLKQSFQNKTDRPQFVILELSTARFRLSPNEQPLFFFEADRVQDAIGATLRIELLQITISSS